MRLRVLIIEDDNDLAEALREILISLGNVVEFARTGAEGCALAREFLPDVVFCDFFLPLMDGAATARALRSDPRTAHAQLVAVTGDVQALEEQGRAKLFDAILLKPFGLEAVQSVLKRQA